MLKEQSLNILNAKDKLAGTIRGGHLQPLARCHQYQGTLEADDLGRLYSRQRAMGGRTGLGCSG